MSLFVFHDSLFNFQGKFCQGCAKGFRNISIFQDLPLPDSFSSGCPLAVLVHVFFSWLLIRSEPPRSDDGPSVGPFRMCQMRYPSRLSFVSASGLTRICFSGDTLHGMRAMVLSSISMTRKTSGTRGSKRAMRLLS